MNDQKSYICWFILSYCMYHYYKNYKTETYNLQIFMFIFKIKVLLVIRNKILIDR